MFGMALTHRLLRCSGMLLYSDRKEVSTLPLENPERSAPLFPLGRTLITPGAQETLDELGTDPSTLVARHHSGDWGNLSDADKQLNQEALRDGERLLSSYIIGSAKVYVITE